MKKLFLLSLILANLLFVQHLYAAKSVWDGRSSDTSWYDDNSSEYHINSATQFKGFADLVSFNQQSFEGKTIYLDCDIDLDNQPWSPIGLHSGKPFYGVFDGQNHSITNLYINTDRFEYPDMKDNVGLFGYAVKAEIKNISVEGVVDVNSGKYIGGIAAFVDKIENIYCDIKINLIANMSSCLIGEVVGSASEGYRIYCMGELKCTNGYLFQQCFVGGIAGSCANMSECCSCVEMSLNKIGDWDSNYYGGISGMSSKSISNAIFTGSISVQNTSSTTDNVINCTAGISGSVSGEVNNVISAPSFMTYGRGMYIGKSVLIPSISTPTISNAYYVNTWATNNEVYGTAISEYDLKSGSLLPGFDTNIWEFNANEYPSLISLKSLMPVPTYTVTYYVDGEIYQVDEYKDGETVIPPADPTKEGYTFDGWGYIPPFISGNSWIVYGSFSRNSYVITYMVDDEVIKTVTQEYDTYIELPTAYPLKQGYLFQWGEYPYRVPAHDVTIVGYYTDDTYEFVDLGLPSGLLWATKNIGAANPENYGYYFSWGEAILKESYYWGTYSYCNGSGTALTKYCNSSEFGEVDGKDTLDDEDDAASTNWGSPWRLPTMEEGMELYNNCTWSIGNLNGAIGCYVTGPNGNSIFLPAAGKKQYMTQFNQGKESYLLTSTISDGQPDEGILIYFDDTSYGLYSESRCYGFSARPVMSVKETVGKCGENLQWEYSRETKTLTISGTGEMWDYEKSLNVNNPSPWYNFIDEIEIISIEEGVSSIGNFAFIDCTNAIKVFMPLSVTSIGKYSFYNCTSLSVISDLTNVSTIEEFAFRFCSSLTSVTFGDKLSTIGSSAFSGCKGLTSLTIPSSVTFIDDLAFYVCTGIDKIVVEEGNTEYDSREDCNALIKTSTNTLLLGSKNTIIPNGVTCINGYAFSEINEITSIVIPNSVTVINHYAFYGCSNLTRVVLGNELKQIQMYAFYGCHVLADVYCYAKDVPEALFWGREKAFDGEEDIILHVPSASIDAYKSTAPWSGFKEIVALTDNDPKPNDNDSGIPDIRLDVDSGVKYTYDLQGNKRKGYIKGVNILKMKNGQTKKIVVK